MTASPLIVSQAVQSQIELLFLAINSPNSFATINYDAHINTKFEYSINHVFRSMCVDEHNTLHTICEVEHSTINFSRYVC